jgi:hypothetical protein
MLGRYSNPKNIQATVTGATIQQPIDMQFRLQTIVQTHQGIAIVASGNAYGAGYVSTEGYDRLVAFLNNDAATTSSADLSWSMDGVNEHAVDAAVIPSNTTKQKKTGELPILAPWVRFKIINGDSAAQHFFNGWLFLKV